MAFISLEKTHYVTDGDVGAIGHEILISRNTHQYVFYCYRLLAMI